MQPQRNKTTVDAKKQLRELYAVTETIANKLGYKLVPIERHAKDAGKNSDHFLSEEEKTELALSYVSYPELSLPIRILLFVIATWPKYANAKLANLVNQVNRMASKLRNNSQIKRLEPISPNAAIWEIVKSARKAIHSIYSAQKNSRQSRD